MPPKQFTLAGKQATNLLKDMKLGKPVQLVSKKTVVTIEKKPRKKK